MRTIYAIQLQFTSPPGQSASALFDDVTGRVSKWVEEKYRRAWAIDLSVAIDGQSLTPRHDHSVRYAFMRGWRF